MLDSNERDQRQISAKIFWQIIVYFTNKLEIPVVIISAKNVIMKNR